MSENDDLDPGRDPLLRALRELRPAGGDPHGDARARAARAGVQAKRGFVEAFEDRPLHVRLLGGGLRRAAVPLVLAGVVGIYLSWAVSAATALTP